MLACWDSEREKWLHDPYSNAADIALWGNTPHQAWLWYDSVNIYEERVDAGWQRENKWSTKKFMKFE